MVSLAVTAPPITWPIILLLPVPPTGSGMSILFDEMVNYAALRAFERMTGGGLAGL